MVILNEIKTENDKAELEDIVDTPKELHKKPEETVLTGIVSEVINEDSGKLLYVTNYVVPEGTFEIIYTPRIELKKPKKEGNGNKLFDITKLHEQIYLWFEKKGVLRNLKVYMKSPYQKVRELLWYKDNPADGFMDKRFRVYGKAR